MSLVVSRFMPVPSMAAGMLFFAFTVPPMTAGPDHDYALP